MAIRVPLTICCALAGLALAGCGAAGSAGSSGPATTPARPAAARPAGDASSVPPGRPGPPPSWASRLGENVLIEAPTTDPSPDTPQWVVSSYVRHLVSADGGSACAYLVATANAYCKHGYAGNVSVGDDVTYGYKSFGLGYTAIYQADKALVGTVRTGLCDHPMEVNCVADNQDPAALLDSGQSFAALWKAAHHPNGGYTLTPLVKVDGTWYIDTAAILGG